MRRVILSLLFLAGCAGENPALPPPDTEPARVKIVEVGRVVQLPDQILVPVALENEGGPGYFKLLFISARSQTNAPADWTVETELFAVERGYRKTLGFLLRERGPSRLEGISVFSRGRSSSDFTRWHVYVSGDPSS